MNDESCRRSRAHLVEDVILTLGNIRAALGWIRDEGVGAAIRDNALDRIERDIGALEDRAAALRDSAAPAPFLLEDPLPPPAKPGRARRGQRAALRARGTARAAGNG